MARAALDPRQVLRESGTEDPLEYVRLGVAAARAKDFERGLIFLAEAYRQATAGKSAKLPSLAFSYYGLCLAMHKGKFKEAAEFCQIAIDKEFYNAEHYLNLARIWLAGRSRRKAVEALNRGISLEPRNADLLQLREEIGFRRKPVIGFLDREHPVNVTLGRVRHSLTRKPAKHPRSR
ncbi:MAG TPA: hypothetical protein VLW17_08140 [Thermoanaerobaculaceae bacterium]|nr:hypothetical protein [Thermoanaerobaculaceae bacterium]